MLSVENLKYSYSNGIRKAEAVFNNLSFDLRRGELLCIVGPSGCGKSTLLNLIAGFLSPIAGKIEFSGNTASKKKIGYIFQNDALLPWRKVRGNIILGLEVNGQKSDGYSESALNSVIEEYLDIFNLNLSILEKFPAQLSGGMRQRVSLIQSLMYNPDLLLLDEPFASLDFYTKLKLESEFWNMVQKKNKTAILVTHDIDEAIAISHRILVMGKSPEGIKEEIKIDFKIPERTPEVVRGHPAFTDYFNVIWNELKEGIKSE